MRNKKEKKQKAGHDEAERRGGNPSTAVIRRQQINRMRGVNDARQGKERQPGFVATAMAAGEQKLANPFFTKQNQMGFGIAADIPDRSRATEAVSKESNRTPLLSGPTQHGPGRRLEPSR